MQTKIRIFRIVLVAIGLETIGASVMGMYGCVTQLQAWQVDPRSVIVGLSLSVLLAVGGGCLVGRGFKYNGRAS